jgi:hypothetical protein
VNIDRERFLVLTATLAMGVALAPAGCATEAPPQAPVAPPPPAPAPTVIYVMVPAAPMAMPAPMTTGTASQAPIPPPPLPPTLPLQPVAQSPDPYKGTPIHAQACDPALNMKGVAPACALRPPPGPTCESISDTKEECPTLNKLFKPRVAQAAIECLNRRSGTKDICEFNVSSICAYEALQSACLEPYAKSACTKVMARCGPAPKGHYSHHDKMTQDACEAGVSGVADAKRAKFLSCISESCRFETCLTYM